MSSSYPPPHPFFPSSSTTVPFIRNPYQMNYHHTPPSPLYYPYPPHFDGSVNLNNPYIYDPTHVKHRRRTTPEQLKVLEETFKTDPKPNPALRKQLSLELGMTPRVLQVWFQNRRMKVKRLVKKQTDHNPNSFSEEQAVVSATTDSALEEHEQDRLVSSSISPSNATGGTEITSTPASASTPTPTPPSGSPSSSPAPSPSSPPSYPDLTHRRSSLPLTIGFPSSSNHHLSSRGFHQQQQLQSPLKHHHQHQHMPWSNNINSNNSNRNSTSAMPHDAASNSFTGGNGPTFDSLTDPLLPRRRSFTSLRRLESHPFAPLVAAGNGVAIPLSARQGHLFHPSEPLSTPAPPVTTTNPESLLDTSASTSSLTSSANNTSCISVTVPLFLPLPVVNSTATTTDKAAEGFVTRRSTSLQAEDLKDQDFLQNHSQDSRKLSSADGSEIFGPAAPPGSDLKESSLGRPTSEATLGSPGESGEINRQGRRLPGLATTADVHNQGSQSALSVQQPTLPPQRSHSTSQVRKFLTNHHPSSTLAHNFTHGAEPAQGPSLGGVMSPTRNNLTHAATHTPMGVVQPGLRSASFHGIIPNSDNYHAYYNRQIPAGQGVPVGFGRDIGIQKGFGYGQSLAANSGHVLHSTQNGLQHQVMQLGNRGYLHTGHRSLSSTSLIDHSNSHQGTGLLPQFSRPYQQSHHHGSLPPHPQFRQSETDPVDTQPPYTYPPRSLSSLLPGPLPAADYSFGTATSNADSEMRETDEEVQDDKQLHYATWDSDRSHDNVALNNMHNSAGSASNNASTQENKGYESRFGSLASLASVPSVPSVSEGGTTTEWEWDWEFEGLRDVGDERRGSCTGQVAQLLSTLEVGSRRGSEESIHSSHSGHLLNVPGGMPPTNLNHLHDPNKTQQISYTVPDVDLGRDSDIAVGGNESESKTDTTGFDEKEGANEQGDDEDQRKTPSASPPMTKSEETKKAYQEMDLYSKSIHGNLTMYSLLPPASVHHPVPDFYNANNVGIDNEYVIPDQFGAPTDIPFHASMGIGMNMNMGVDIGEPFRYQNVNVGYVSEGQGGSEANAEDNMFGIERYPATTTTAGGAYDGAY